MEGEVKEPTKADHAYLNLVITCVLVQDYLAEIKGTDRYRAQMKVAANQLAIQVEKVLAKDLKTFWKMDEEMCINQLRNLEGLVKNLASFRLDELLLFGQLIEKYKENPAEFAKEHEIIITKVNGHNS